MEREIIIKDGLSVQQLRQLFELQNLNKALNSEEFFKIVSVYNQAIERLLGEENK